MAKVIEVTRYAEIEAVIEAERATVVEVHARARCAPCRVIAPHFDAASTEHPYATFLSVDLDAVPEDDELPQRLRISALPTFVLFLDGKETDRFVGAAKAKLDGMLQRADPRWDDAFRSGPLAANDFSDF